MLVELAVRDLGVIESLSLTFAPGMTALTGETGAGKTLLVEAIELLTGGRADPVLVRPGAAEAVVEGRFEVAGEERILTRVVPADGRSRAYLDGRMAPVAALAELAEDVVDLHGQHAHQSLLRAAGQRQALDTFAGVDLAPLRHARARAAAADESLTALGGDERTRAQELALLAFQLEEIDAAALSDVGEEQALEAEEDLLSAATAHREAAEAALALLAADGAAADLLGRTVALTAGRPPLADSHQRLEGLAAELADVASALRERAESITEDPERLDEVRARRQLIRDLRRKYGSSIEEILAFAFRARGRRDELVAFESRAAALEAEGAAAREAVTAAEAELGAQRRRAAPELARRVAEEMQALALPSARLEVEVGVEDPGDAVTFMFCANPGAALLPLAKVASGGELARVMLAARLVLSQGPPVLVFDEVDAGVGGAAAVAVGRALAALTRDHQVLVVTHLPQVAAHADHQVAVRKTTRSGATRTEVEVLDGEARVIELSRMLAGLPDSRAARDHALELLEGARGAKGS